MRYSFHRTQLLPAALVLLAVLQFVVTSPLLLAKNIPRSPESREAAGLVQPEPLEVTPRSLHKRKCTENGQKSKKGNPKFTCDDDPIARDEIRDRAKPQSNVATLFYVNLNQGQGLKQGKAYLKDKNIAWVSYESIVIPFLMSANNVDSFVSYDTLVDNLWSKAVAQNFQQSPDDAVKANVDRYQKCQSQVGFIIAADVRRSAHEHRSWRRRQVATYMSSRRATKSHLLVQHG